MTGPRVRAVSRTWGRGNSGYYSDADAVPGWGACVDQMPAAHAFLVWQVWLVQTLAPYLPLTLLLRGETTTSCYNPMHIKHLFRV